MSQIQAQRLAAERKQIENQFDITQYEHVPRRYYGRMFFATLIVVFVIGLGNAFAKGQIEWSYVGQFLTSQAILFGLLNTIVMSILAMTLGVIFGVVIAIMRMSSNPILQYVALAYVVVQCAVEEGQPTLGDRRAAHGRHPQRDMHTRNNTLDRRILDASHRHLPFGLAISEVNRSHGAEWRLEAWDA